MMFHTRCFSFPVTEHWFKVLFYSLCSTQSHMMRPRAQPENWLCSQLFKVFIVVTIKCFHNAAVEWPISLTNRMKATRFTEAKRLKAKGQLITNSPLEVCKMLHSMTFQNYLFKADSSCSYEHSAHLLLWLKIPTDNLREAQSKQGKPVQSGTPNKKRPHQTHFVRVIFSCFKQEATFFRPTIFT